LFEKFVVLYIEAVPDVPLKSYVYGYMYMYGGGFNNTGSSPSCTLGTPRIFSASYACKMLKFCSIKGGGMKRSQVSSLLHVQVHEVSTEDEEEEEEEGEVIEEHEGTESEGEESGGEVYSSLPAEVLSSLSLSTGPRGGQWPSLCLCVYMYK